MSRKPAKAKTEYVPFELKADKNFRMAKTTKAMLALMPFRDQEDRNSFKRGMIVAQLAEEAAKRTPLKRERGDVSD
jgi:hypothetical protein